MDSEEKKARTQLIYNGIAPYYDNLRLFLKRKDIPVVLDILDIEDGDVVLDAGMGPGVYTFEILKRKNPHQVVGVDLSENFVMRATEKAQKKCYNNVEFHKADLENLPFEDQSFDKIICSGVLLIIPDQAKALRELHRVLKTGGKFVVVEPLDEVYLGKEIFYVFAKIFLKVLSFQNPELRKIERPDFAGRYFSEAKLYSLLNSIGFQQVEVRRNRVEAYGICRK